MKAGARGSGAEWVQGGGGGQDHAEAKQREQEHETVAIE